MMIFGMDWRPRLLLVLGASCMLLGALFVTDPMARLLLAALGLLIIIAGGVVQRRLKRRVDAN